MNKNKCMNVGLQNKFTCLSIWQYFYLLVFKHKQHKRLQTQNLTYEKENRLCHSILLQNEIAARDEILSLFASHVTALNQIYNNAEFRPFNATSPCYQGIRFQIQRTKVKHKQQNTVSKTLSARHFHSVKHCKLGFSQ